ncbi:MAG: hypothetical protein WBA84_05600 [Carnobacterium sp.]|uniref:hypothetical protein n=1 Tax=Carnobacterium sp. TaxID=48221 RepID=UPI003C71289A
METFNNSGDYKNFKKKRERNRSIEMLLAGADSIPVVGATVGKIINLVLENVSDSSKIKTIISKKNNQRFFIAPCDNLYEELQGRIIEILENTLIQKQFSYSMADIISLEIYELVQEELDGDQYTDMIKINFSGDDSETIMIEFVEKYTQINFSEKKVYGLYEIISSGGNNQYSKRNYIELASVIYSLISLL